MVIKKSECHDELSRLCSEALGSHKALQRCVVWSCCLNSETVHAELSVVRADRCLFRADDMISLRNHDRISDVFSPNVYRYLCFHVHVDAQPIICKTGLGSSAEAVPINQSNWSQSCRRPTMHDRSEVGCPCFDNSILRNRHAFSS